MTIRDHLFSLPLPSWLFVLVTTVYHEWMLLAWSGQRVSLSRILLVTALALGFGLALGLLVSMLPRRLSKWAAVALSLLLTAAFLTEYFLSDAYQTYMTPATVWSGAGGIAADYSALVASLVGRNLWRLGLLLLPALGYGLFCENPEIDWHLWGWLAGSSLGSFLLAALLIFAVTRDADVLTGGSHFDTAVRSFGLSAAVALDAVRFVPEADPEFTLSQPEQSEHTGSLPRPRYGYNELPELDFETLLLTEYSGTRASLHRYVSAQLPSEKNRYTGLFAGKNLIFITAEAFSPQVIDPELTPTLYRLANQGIRFTNYYQPSWGGSTTGGEFSNLVGLVPVGGNCMQEPMEQNLFLTLGNQFQALGYHTAAYHNHTAAYYNRETSHVALGYSKLIARGSGLDAITPVWPESDREMIDLSVPQYLDKQPFHIYYMTVSGHCGYRLDSNAQSAKNYPLVSHLDLPEVLKGYLAAQLELESALTSLMDQLEKAGIEDDTVIVLATDHYPYGLEESSTWGNTEDYLSQWYGQPVTSKPVRDQNTLILWCGAIEGMDITVEEPVYSLDILPTLSNLFGLPFDSRLLVGRDVFSDREPLVLWPDHSWLTDQGFYDAPTRTFTPAGDTKVPERYIQSICSQVKDKLAYCDAVLRMDYFNYLKPNSN